MADGVVEGFLQEVVLSWVWRIARLSLENNLKVQEKNPN